MNRLGIVWGGHSCPPPLTLILPLTLIFSLTLILPWILILPLPLISWIPHTPSSVALPHERDARAYNAASNRDNNSGEMEMPDSCPDLLGDGYNVIHNVERNAGRTPGWIIQRIVE